MNTILAVIFIAVVYLNRFVGNITIAELFICSALTAIIVQLEIIISKM